MIERHGLVRFAYISVIAALATISLKAAAYLLTGSIGLLSDALESLVNLVAALVALVALWVAARPEDKEHTYGHTKAEYFSSGFEGALILIAAASILVAAGRRLLEPQPIVDPAVGLAMTGFGQYSVDAVLGVSNYLPASWIILAAGTVGAFANLAMRRQPVAAHV